MSSIDWEAIKNTNTDNLRRIDLGSNLDFSDVNISISGVRQLLLDAQNILVANPNIGTLIASFAKRFKRIVTEIGEFTQSADETPTAARNRRDAIVSALYDLDAELQKELVPLILYRRDYEPIYTQIENRLGNINQTAKDWEQRLQSGIQHIEQLSVKKESDFDARINRTTQEIRKEVSDSLVRAEEIKRNIESSSVDSLTEKYGKIFSDQADSYKRKGYLALGISIGAMILAGIFSWLAFSVLISDFLSRDLSVLAPGPTWAPLILVAFLKITIVGFALIIIFESLKDYHVNMHLRVLNQHRHNALCTATQILSLIENDNQLRAGIVQQVTEVIYGNQSIGYLSENKKAPTLSEIADLFKAIRP